jgi:DUF3048 family protein
LARTPSLAAWPLRRKLITLIAIAIAALAIAVTARLGTLTPGGAAAAPSSAASVPAASAPGTSVAPTSTPVAPTAPPPTQIPLVPAPLTGLPVTVEAAQRHPIAVMVDDHADARPQAGFNAASVVWQAPAEGGVPRYMFIFQDQIPKSVGPIRSARQYYIQWAAELKAMYVHHGGSPQAKATLSARGDGTWVYNADGFRWSPRYLWRVHDRTAPHNVMTDGSHLRQLAKRLGADDGPIEPAWSFGPDAPSAERPTGGTIKVVYPYETITYRYDPVENRYLRFINSSKQPQIDIADRQVVAPKNVVILRMEFGALSDAHPEKKRLEAHNIGKGVAWIASNGVTVKGTWRKASATSPTRLFGPDGQEIILTAGQTFVQVLALSYDYRIKDGALPGTASTSP